MKIGRKAVESGRMERHTGRKEERSNREGIGTAFSNTETT